MRAAAEKIMKVGAEKIIEASPIRLTVDETRAILRAQQATGKPINGGYAYPGLVDLGIFRRVLMNEDTREKRAKAWAQAKAAVARKDRVDASRALEAITLMDRKEKEYGYVLTDLGKQLARGITVKMGAQFRK